MDSIQQMNGVPQTQLKRNDKLWAAAQSLESNFLAEMLKSTGLGKSRESFGGGAGEDQFSSFLVQEYADSMVSAGGIGLAETLYKSLIQINMEKSS